MEPSMRPINSPGQTQNVKWLDGNVQGNRVNTPTASNMPIANYPQIETPATQTGQKPIDNRPQSILPKHEAKRSPMKALLVILIILNIVFVGLFGYYVNKSNSLSDEISDQEEEYDILLDENDEMDKNNKKLAKDKKQLEVEFSDIYQQYNTSKSDYESLDENYSTLESTNDNLNEELDTLKINYSELQAELDKLQDEYDELNQTYYDLIEYYYNQTEVLTRDRKIYREFKGTYDWPGHTSQFFYTLEGYLSDYFESLQRDHSFDYLNKESDL